MGAERRPLSVSGSPMPVPDQFLPPEPHEVSVEYARDLTEADVAALSLPRPGAQRPLTRIYASHHSLARCIATGLRVYDAALVTGYSPARINALQKDPAFMALVADYRREASSLFADMGARLHELSLDAIEILQERLHEHPDDFSIAMLLDVIRTGADRSGFGPGQSLNVRMEHELVDRPPRENFEDWMTRRAKELAPGEPKALVHEQPTVIDAKKLN